MCPIFRLQSKYKVRKIFSYERGRQLLLFVFCLFLALFVWTIHRMSGDFNHIFQYKIYVKTNITGRKSTSLSENEITLRARTSGFYILQQKYSKRKRILTLDLNSRSFEKLSGSEDVFYVVTSNIRDAISEGLGEKGIVEYVAADTVRFVLPVETSKEVPISFKKNITYRDQYMPVGEVRLKPDRVLISGEKSILDGVDSVATETINLSRLASSVTDIVSIKKIPGLRYSEEESYYTINVERYIEKSYKFPVSILNVPDSISLLTSPSEVTLVCRLPFKRVRAFDESSIEMVADYRDMLELNSSMLKIRPVAEADEILEYKIEPPFLEIVVIGKIDR